MRRASKLWIVAMSTVAGFVVACGGAEPVATEENPVAVIGTREGECSQQCRSFAGYDPANQNCVTCCSASCQSSVDPPCGTPNTTLCKNACGKCRLIP